MSTPTWGSSGGHDGPQDAPLEPTTQPPRAAETVAPVSPPETTYVAAPTGPHWPLVLLGLALILVAVGVILNQLNGFEVSALHEHASLVLVAAGGFLALVGVVGMAARRKS